MSEASRHEPARTCVCYVIREVRRRRRRYREVLLGRKRRGFGVGNLVGPGGHIEAGETAAEAAARELAEEAGLRVDPGGLRPAGRIVYRFPLRPEDDMAMEIFTVPADRTTGTPLVSDELEPHWCRIDRLPVNAMWDDARYWLPGVLDGGSLDAEIVFAHDGRTVGQLYDVPEP